jgi:hypothetical protein
MQRDSKDVAKWCGKEASERGEQAQDGVHDTRKLVVNGILRGGTKFNRGPRSGLGSRIASWRGNPGVEVARGTEMRGHVRKDTDDDAVEDIRQHHDAFC